MADRNIALAVLAAAPWLAPDGERLAPLLVAAGRMQTREVGAWVHGEGDEDTGLLVVLEGAIDLYCHGLGGRAGRIGRVAGGGAIGQSLRFGGGPRLVTAVCAERTLVLQVSDASLTRIAEQSPEIWRAVTRLLYGQLRHALQTAADALTLPPRQHLAARLHELTRGRRSRTLKLSQSALAEMTGLERRAVHIALRNLVREGVLTLGYRKVAVAAPERLLEIARS